MRDDLEQEEQLEAIKAFWQKHKARLVAGLLALALAASGIQAMRVYQARQAAAASDLLFQVESQLAQEQIAEATATAAELERQHSRSLPASLSALAMAKTLANAGDLPAALTQLQLASQSKDEAVAWVARVRQAAVLIDLNRAAEGLKVLDGRAPEAMTGLVEDRRGDLYALAGDAVSAQTAWTKARDFFKAQGQDSAQALALVERKLATVNAFPKP